VQLAAAVAEGADAGFVVRRVGTTVENGVLTVGIAADPDATARCLLFSIQIDISRLPTKRGDSRHPGLACDFQASASSGAFGSHQRGDR
jgi:hypothetical protein